MLPLDQKIGRPLAPRKAQEKRLYEDIAVRMLSLYQITLDA